MFWLLALLGAIPAGPAATSDAENTRWLRENSGLTWDQLGKLFGVSRRTVHLWANGARMNTRNAEALAQAVGMVKGIAAQTPDARRTAILANTNGKASLFEALAVSTRNGHEPINAPAFRAADSLDLIPGDGTMGA
jgi:DNA-binding XRE family transcriptional regulator